MLSAYSFTSVSACFFTNYNMKVLFVDTVHEILSQRLKEKGAECLHLESAPKTEIEKHYPSIEGLVIRSKFPVSDGFLDRCPKLKFIARSGAGMENIDIQECEQRGVQLFNSPEGNCNAVGEHALGLLLAGFNKLAQGHQQIQNGVWDREGNRGLELDGKTVGIIGFGNNGQAFAKKLRGFDVELLAYDKYKTNFGNDQVKEVNLQEIQAKCEVLSFHVPQNAETLFYFNDDFLSRMKRSFFLLNVSRGKVVSLGALHKGFQTKKIIGAGLDVFEFESSNFEKSLDEITKTEYEWLFKSDKVILSPHVAGWTIESYYKLSSVLADKIIRSFFEKNSSCFKS
jgi:D-3-phosphoglycerate dehydrogenase